MTTNEITDKQRDHFNTILGYYVKSFGEERGRVLFKQFLKDIGIDANLYFLK